MRLSIVLSTQPASFSALAYKGHWEENIRKIKSLGYDGVELAVRDPRLLDEALLKSVLEQHGMRVPAIGTGQAFGEDGLSFTHADSIVRRLAIERVKSHMRMAKGLGALVIIGLVRGRRGADVSAGMAEEWLIEALRECASAESSVRLAIEPINRYETDLVNTAASALDLLKTTGRENIGLLLDTFHMNIEEPSFGCCIGACREHLIHVHIADSNRWYPGAGHTDFGKIVNSLRDIGYEGFLSAEILPLPDPDTAAAKTIEYMRALAS